LDEDLTFCLHLKRLKGRISGLFHGWGGHPKFLSILFKNFIRINWITDQARNYSKHMYEIDRHSTSKIRHQS
jgi:hypothetical protein